MEWSPAAESSESFESLLNALSVDEFGKVIRSQFDCFSSLNFFFILFHDLSLDNRILSDFLAFLNKSERVVKAFSISVKVRVVNPVSILSRVLDTSDIELIDFFSGEFSIQGFECLSRMCEELIFQNYTQTFL